MKIEEAIVGTRIRTLVSFCNVPEGTMGVIDEDYGTGVMIAWNLPEQPLPKGYVAYDGKPAVASGILRDGFDKKTELYYLEKI